MKILLLSPDQISNYNWGHQLFRNELNNHAQVFYYGPGYDTYDPVLNVQGVINRYGFKPDLILTYGLRYSLEFEGLDEVTIPKAHIIIDFFPARGDYKGSWDRSVAFFKKNKYDIYFTRYINQIDYLDQAGVKGLKFWLPFSVDETKYVDQGLDRKDCIFTSSNDRKDVYPDRARLKNLLRKKFTIINDKVFHERYINSINASKICFINTNVFNTFNMKYTEFSACGSFILTNECHELDSLGYKDGEHLVIYRDDKDLIDKASYYLEHDKERERIAANGKRWTLKHFTNKEMVNGLIKTLEAYHGKREIS
jgi:hypothetical protein